jgi:S1-C subfamily serine protease
MKAVKIIKRKETQILTEAAIVQGGTTDRQDSREIAKTVKGWVAELHQRRRDEQLASFAFRKFRTALSVMVLSILGLSGEGSGQQLRDAFRRVEGAVVILRTNQRELAPFPQSGMVSLNGLGSGVVISNDGKVLTAAHLVQSADKTIVEFADGEMIPARVTGSTFSADVALLQLERLPGNTLAAILGNSDKVEVGDQIFVVGAPYGNERGSGRKRKQLRRDLFQHDQA